MADRQAIERWQRIETLFRGAVELPDDERRAFLDAACDGDAELRREVDELLAADREAGDFITTAVKEGEQLLNRSAEILPAGFGKYEVESRLGEGGFGVVYRGWDPMLDRPVAIKACSGTDLSLRKRFYREARIAAGLRHANITTVHELGVEDGVPFIVQELLDGEDLRQVMRSGRPLSVATAIGYLAQIARGLEHAHGAGVLHRDIKPANVRIQPDGTVKLMDFGIAKVLGADTGLTGTGMTLGTVGYLAPEQLRSEEVDERADIFSFGVLAYELLGQTRPFRGDDFSQVSYQLLYVEPSPLLSLRPQCPEPVAELVHRCLHKNKLQRPGSMLPVRRVLEELSRSLPDATDQSPQVGGPELQAVERSEEMAESPGSGRLSDGDATRRRTAWTLAGALGAMTLWVLMSTWGKVEPGHDAPPTTGALPEPVISQPMPPPSELDAEQVSEAEAPLHAVESSVVADTTPSPAMPEAGGLDAGAAPGAESGRTVPGRTVPGTGPTTVPGTERSAATDGPTTVPGTGPTTVPGTERSAATDGPTTVPGTVRDAAADDGPMTVPGTLRDAGTDSAPVSTAFSEPSNEMSSASDESEPARHALPAMALGDMITGPGPGVVAPRILERPQPDYPARARRRGIEGQVVVKVLVDERGGVVQVIAPGSDEHGFLAAARKAAAEARFAPATRDGIGGRMWVNLNFDFTLD